jgi:hypothetical protein
MTAARMAIAGLLAAGFLMPGLGRPALAQDTNQDDPVKITPCAWLTSPANDTTWLILGRRWAGNKDVAATRRMAAACIKAAPEAVLPPSPCPGGMIGVMTEQHATMCGS